MPQTPRKAVVYARISDARGEDTTGVDRQIEDCAKLCEQRGYELVATYVDNSISAYAQKPRPQFERLMAAAEAKQFDVVIVWAADRLYRRLNDLERIVDGLSGIEVATVTSGRVDLATADGRMTARILGSVAQHESEKKGERISRAYEQRARQGKFVGGPRRIGYTDDATELVPEEADAIRDGYQAILDGKSLRSIIRDWNARGLRTSYGNPYEAYPIRKVFLRPMNAGHASYKGELLENASPYPKIVDHDTWLAVKVILEDPARQPHDGRPARSLLSGISRCGVCGGKVLASQKSARGVYRCNVKHCVSRTRRLLDPYVTQAALTYLGAHRERLASAIGGRTEVFADSSTEIAEASRLRRDLTTLPDLLASGDLSPDDYASAMRRLRDRLAAVESRISAATTGPSATLELLKSHDLEASWEELDIDGQRAVLKELIDHIRIDRAPKHGSSLEFVEIVWRDHDANAPVDLQSARGRRAPRRPKRQASSAK